MFRKKTHTIYQQDCDPNNGDVSSGYGPSNIHTLSQCEDSSKFKGMDGDVGKGDGDMSSGNAFLNSHTLSQSVDSGTFQVIDVRVEKADVSSGYGSMNSHTDLQHNILE